MSVFARLVISCPLAAVIGVSAFLFPGCGVVQKPSWIPPSPLNEVVIRQIPSCNVIEAEVNGTLERGWQKGFRQDARYLSFIHSPLQYPVLINVPAWEGHEPQSSGLFYVELILEDQPNYDNPHEKGQSVVTFGRKTVACYAWEGPYSYEKFVYALQRVRKFLRERSIPTSGPPRIVLYRNPDWIWKAWLVGEVQIPVPEKINTD